MFGLYYLMSVCQNEGTIAEYFLKTKLNQKELVQLFKFIYYNSHMFVFIS